MCLRGTADSSATVSMKKALLAGARAETDIR
jgi:hypothetical protein